jgi:hypothetical protein
MPVLTPIDHPASEDPRYLLDAGKAAERMGDDATAYTLFRRSVDVAHARGDPEALGWARLELGRHSWEYLPPTVDDLFAYRHHLARQALSDFRKAGNVKGIAAALRCISADVPAAEAVSLLEKSLAISRSVGDADGEIATLERLANLMCTAGGNCDGNAMKARAIQLARALPSCERLPSLLFSIGVTTEGRCPERREFFLEAARLYRHLGSMKRVAECLGYCGYLACDDANVDLKEACLKEALEIADEMRRPGLKWLCFAGLAEVARQRGEVRMAEWYESSRDGLFVGPAVAPKILAAFRESPSVESLRAVLRCSDRESAEKR